jgi:FkbM family methyltransferase
MNGSAPPVRDLVYDVGLHRGEDSAFYLAKGYRVVAFEANPDLVSVCQGRFLTEIAEGRMTIVEGAISGVSEPTVRFYKHPNSLWGTTNERAAARDLVVLESEAVDVPAVKLADVIRHTGIPSFIKIDIEGSDTLCLEALLEFDSKPDFVSVESSRERSALKAQFSLLEQLGYDRFVVVQQAQIAGREIVTQTLDRRSLSFRFAEDASGLFGSDVGPWVERAAAFRRVALAYGLFGYDSLLCKSKLGRAVRYQAERHLGRPLPGWYDTHAAHSSTVGHR